MKDWRGAQACCCRQEGDSTHRHAGGGFLSKPSKY